MIETILLALSPIVVSAISQGSKKLVSKKRFTNGFRKKAIIFGVAVLSYGAVLGTALLSGGDVNVLATETFSTAFLTFLAASGTYFFVKGKKAPAPVE